MNFDKFSDEELIRIVIVNGAEEEYAMKDKNLGGLSSCGLCDEQKKF